MTDRVAVLRSSATLFLPSFWGGFLNLAGSLWGHVRGFRGSGVRGFGEWLVSHAGATKDGQCRMTDYNCHRSSVVEHTLGKGEVTGSNPVGGLDKMLL